jgi:hypothetical protein
MITAIVLGVSLPACVQQEVCRQELGFRSFDLNDWCVTSGQCSFLGTKSKCEIRTEPECKAACANATDYAECMHWCTTTVDAHACPFLGIGVGDDVDWDYPIGLLGARRKGLDLFRLPLRAGAPLPGVTLSVVADGIEVCSAHGTDVSHHIFVSCPIPSDTERVWVTVTGHHPAFRTYPELREATPTKWEEVCAL